MTSSPAFLAYFPPIHYLPIMRTLSVILLILPIIVTTQNFFQGIDFPPVEQSGYVLQQPWAGGFNDSDPALVDIDNDGDLDFFCGNDDGGMQFFRNEGTSVSPDFRREFEVNDYNASSFMKQQ